VTRHKIYDEKKDWMLLGFILSNPGCGFREILIDCRRVGSRELRIGSQHTLEDRLAKLEARGLIGKAQGRPVGRGHKSGYFVTLQGKRLLQSKGLVSPSINFESPELEFLKLLPNTCSKSREIAVFSDPALSIVSPNEETTQLLDRACEKTTDAIREIEDSFEKAHKTSEAFLKSGRFDDDQKRILEVLRRRYTFQRRRRIRPGGRYPLEVKQMVRTLREENARLPKEKRRGTFRGELTVDNLPFELVGKRLDNVPLGRKEFQRYQKLVKLERRYEEAWAAMKEPSIALLVCNKRYIDELLVRALLVKTQDGKCEITERFLKSLAPRDLLECEKEFWEASNTGKYARDFIFVQCDEKGRRRRLRTGLWPGQGVGLSYPLRASFLSLQKLASAKEAWDVNIPSTIRLRKEYFERMHAAISKEVKSRSLTTPHHNARATYMDIVGSHRKQLESQYGRLREPKIKEEDLRIEVTFTIRGLRRKTIHAKNMPQLIQQFRPIYQSITATNEKA
jgi:hypothetical protein